MFFRKIWRMTWLFEAFLMGTKDLFILCKRMLSNYSTLHICKGLDLAGSWKMIFPTDRVGPGNEKWVYQQAGPGQKGRKTNNIAGQPGPTRQRRSFQTWRKKNNNVLDLVPMCQLNVSFSLHYRIINKIYWSLYCYWMATNLHEVCSFHKSGLLIFL